MSSDLRHDRSRGAPIGRIVLADDDDLAAQCYLMSSDQAAVFPNSGIASLRMVLIAVASTFWIARWSAATHLSNDCIGGSFGFAAMMPGTPISTGGSSLANRI